MRGARIRPELARGDGPGPRRWCWGDPPAVVESYLNSGRIVAIPTGSSYGLAVDPASEEGVARVMALKGRPSDQPLPVIAGSVEALEALGADLGAVALQRVIAAWPAPLTAVVPVRRPIAATLGGVTLAVRVTAHRRLARLLREIGRAVTATSANRTGEPPVLALDEVSRLLHDTDALIIDDGDLAGGQPSTIVGIQGAELTVLREGRYPLSRLGLVTEERS